MAKNPQKKRQKSAKSALISVQHILENLRDLTPETTAEAWDNVGLLVGSKKTETRGAVLSIDLTEEALQVAQSQGYRLIINHHPCIFPKSKGMTSLTGEGKESLIYRTARAGVSVISSHTNFDQCALEVPRSVADALGVVARGRFLDGKTHLTKLVYFVPFNHAEKVNEAIFRAGAGKIGLYDQCAFSTEGVGTFCGLEGSQPKLGKKGKVERVKELRVETIFPRGIKRQILKALKSSHPYEEVAYDLYSVEQKPSGLGLVQGLGYGFFGDYKKSQTPVEFTRALKKAFAVKNFLITGDLPKKIKRIGFVAGKGSSFIPSAIEQGCEIFITGEAGYHDAREASQQGLCVIELGHTQSELYFLKTLEQWCKNWGIRSKIIKTNLQRIEG
jgi:dinuclear metal center YbgI/SA1388 family protein